MQGAMATTRGRFILIGDSYDRYDRPQLGLSLSELREGYDLVIGTRFQGGILPGAMSFLHAGKPILPGIGRLLFKGSVRDFPCGLRSFRRDSIEQLHLQ